MSSEFFKKVRLISDESNTKAFEDRVSKVVNEVQDKILNSARLGVYYYNESIYDLVCAEVVSRFKALGFEVIVADAVDCYGEKLHNHKSVTFCWEKDK